MFVSSLKQEERHETKEVSTGSNHAFTSTTKANEIFVCFGGMTTLGRRYGTSPFGTFKEVVMYYDGRIKSVVVQQDEAPKYKELVKFAFDHGAYHFDCLTRELVVHVCCKPASDGICCSQDRLKEMLQQRRREWWLRVFSLPYLRRTTR